MEQEQIAAAEFKRQRAQRIQQELLQKCLQCRDKSRRCDFKRPVCGQCHGRNKCRYPEETSDGSPPTPTQSNTTPRSSTKPRQRETDQPRTKSPMSISKQGSKSQTEQKNARKRDATRLDGKAEGQPRKQRKLLKSGDGALALQ